jgi:hypothetical protein
MKAPQDCHVYARVIANLIDQLMCTTLLSWDLTRKARVPQVNLRRASAA